MVIFGIVILWLIKRKPFLLVGEGNVLAVQLVHMPFVAQVVQLMEVVIIMMILMIIK